MRSCRRAQTIYTVALNDPVWIRAYVPQPRLGRIKPGMTVKVEIDSVPGKQFDGTVGFISPEAEFTPKSVQTEQVRDDLVYRLRIVAKDPDNVFRQGMPVTVRVPEASVAGDGRQPLTRDNAVNETSALLAAKLDGLRKEFGPVTALGGHLRAAAARD